VIASTTLIRLRPGDYDGHFMTGTEEDWTTRWYSRIHMLIPYYNEPKIRLWPKARWTLE